MNNNQLVIIVIAILVAGGIIVGALYFSFAKQPTEIANTTTNITESNNTTNETVNQNDDVQKQSKSSSDESDSLDAEYRRTTESAMFSKEEGRSYGLTDEETEFHNAVMIYEYERQTGNKW